MPTVILVRHGRTAANAGGVLAGWTPGVHLDDKGNVYAEDDGVRSDASMAGMAKPKPFFDKKYGNVTAANCSGLRFSRSRELMGSAQTNSDDTGAPQDTRATRL